MDTKLSGGRTRYLLIFLPAVMLVLAGLACGGSSSATPTPRATATSAPELASADLEVLLYVVSVGENSTAMSDALTTISELLENPKYGDTAWTVQMAAQLVAIQGAHERLGKLKPPSRMAHVHQAILDATGDCSAATNYIADAIDNLDAGAAEKATELLVSCKTKASAVARLLEEYKTPSAQSSGLSEPVVRENSRLRAGPGTEYDQIGRVPQGTVLTVVGRNEAGDWLMVENPAGGQAWIAAFLIDNVPDPEALPVVPTPPLPTAVPEG